MKSSFYNNLLASMLSVKQISTGHWAFLFEDCTEMKKHLDDTTRTMKKIFFFCLMFFDWFRSFCRISADNDIVDGNMNEFDKVSDETHDQEADGFKNFLISILVFSISALGN